MSLAIKPGGMEPLRDGDLNLYNSPELRSLKWYEHSRRAIFINGMDNTPSDHKRSADLLSTVQACPVVGVYNRTDGKWRDLRQCLADKATLVGIQMQSAPTFGALVEAFDKALAFARKRNPSLQKPAYVESMIAANPATVGLFRLLHRKGYAHRATPIFAHSQGNLITSNALTAFALAHGTQAIQGRIVQSFGSPCRFWPPGIEHHNHAFTFDPVTWLDYKPGFDAIKVGGVAAHSFTEYMKHDPAFVVNRFRWGGLGVTFKLDEAGLARALANMDNPTRIQRVFAHLEEHHSTYADDVASRWVEIMRRPPHLAKLRTMVLSTPILVDTVVHCLTGGIGWTTGKEKAQAAYLVGLIR